MARLSAVRLSNVDTKHGSRLCWAARLVTLASLLSTPVSAYAQAISSHGFSEYDYTWYLVFLIVLSPVMYLSPFYIVALPCVLAWRRHFLGGIVIVAISIEFIWYMLLGPVPYGDGEERLLVAWVLPLWGLSCAGGLLHLATWFMERLRKVGWCRT